MPELPPDGLPRLVAIMARLRDPQTGCEWDGPLGKCY